MSKRLLAISSGGGHWIQLKRLYPAFRGNETFWVTVGTKKSNDRHSLSIIDSNYDTKLKLFFSFVNAFIIVIKIRPHVVISTGAAPGFFGIFWGKIFGARTIWIDSIANVERLSLSGKAASFFSDYILTQWDGLKENKILYKGSIL